jgi:hypothetical protein
VTEADAPSGASEIMTEIASQDGAVEIERVYVDHGARSVVMEHT